MSNLYDVLAQQPALSEKTLFVELEELAQKLVKSGRFRVDAGERLNYVRFSHPAYGIYKIFSKRELMDAALQPITLRHITELLAKRYQGSELDQQARAELLRLQQEISKYVEVTPETEIKLARALVQAAHPSVIMLMLWEEVEVFVAYSHTVGDMLDIEGWQHMGSSSGLQSTAGRRDYCVYTSAGGDPFHHGEHATPYDGKAALARMMVIAAQEMGHFADIQRDHLGRPIGRHSADIGVTRAKENVRLGRLQDIRQAKNLQQQLNQLGLAEGVKKEQSVAFYGKHRKEERIYKTSLKQAQKHYHHFLKQCQKHQLGWITDMPKSDAPMTQLHRMLEDMLFNLAPVAKAYQHDNPTVEEAIACAEALARVPQQALKWNHRITSRLMPSLYAIYYRQLIPTVVQSFEQISGQSYRFSYTKPAQSRNFLDKALHYLNLQKPVYK